MRMAYVCEAPYTRQIQIRTARDLQKGRNRTKGDMTAVQKLVNDLLATTQPVTVPELGLALALLNRISASDGTDTTGLSFCFFKLDLFISFVSVLPICVYVHHMCA